MAMEELRLLEPAAHIKARRYDTDSALTGSDAEKIRLNKYPSVTILKAAGDDITSNWRKWKRHLLRRRRARSLRELAGGGRSALRWNWRDGENSHRLNRLLGVLDHRAAKRATDRESFQSAAREWLTDHGGSLHGCNGAPHIQNGSAAHNPLSDNRGSPAAAALLSLAWLHLLGERPDLFEGELWRQVFRRLREIADTSPPPLDVDPLAHQLAAAELPLALAYLFPELTDGSVLEIAAAAAISQGMTELVDAEGIPFCRSLATFSALAACWTRYRFIADQLHGAGWPNEAESRFPLVLREAVRFQRQDGHMPFADDGASRGRRDRSVWLAVAADFVADKPIRRLLRSAGRDWRMRRGRRFDSDRLPQPAGHSERAQFAVLRSDWRYRSERLTVAYADAITRIELAVGRDVLVSGEWQLELHADGAKLKPIGGWEEVCWVSDQDCDYLELEIDFTGGFRVQRQMLLAREDKFLFLADAVLGGAARELTYGGRLPLCRRLSSSAAVEAREVLLGGDKAQALILPLALPEWQADRRVGALELNSGALELGQSAPGSRLFAPLWIDLSRRRSREAFTWRQLTVAEQRQNLTSDVAAGYRVQFGRRQWLIYRSLAAAANRTVLGQNLSGEFFLGRFQRSGETETLVEIE
jgi:hypothetical protein